MGDFMRQMNDESYRQKKKGLCVVVIAHLYDEARICSTNGREIREGNEDIMMRDMISKKI